MVTFGLLTAEIGLGVWATPANYNGFCVLAALLHGSSSGRQRNFAALNRGRHLYLAVRPSRWALAHTLVNGLFLVNLVSLFTLGFLPSFLLEETFGDKWHRVSYGLDVLPATQPKVSKTL